MADTQTTTNGTTANGTVTITQPAGVLPGDIRIPANGWSGTTLHTLNGKGDVVVKEGEKPGEDPAKEKMYGPMMPGMMPGMSGATSFADMDAAKTAREEQQRLYELVENFGMLSSNVLRSEMVADKPAAIAALVAELSSRMLTGGEATVEAPSSRMMTDGMGMKKAVSGSADTPAQDVAAAETKETDTGGVLGDEASGVLVWKERNGAMRWLGTHTNHYIDRDNPPDILSAEAHQRFAERVAKGIDPAPELWIWHAPVPVGETDYLAWDDRGFLISSGTVKPEWEKAVKALTESGEPLGMSHGMPLESIKRDKNDPRVVLDYTSKEISILPLDKAANLLTALRAKETTMELEKGLRPEQRQRLVGMMGEEHVKQLESEIERKAANAKGLESKETGSEADTLDTLETPPVAEVKAVTPTPAPAPVEGDAPLSRGEIVDAIAVAMESVTAAFGKSINELAVQVEALQKEVKGQKTEMAAQVAEKAAATPKASVAALLSKRLGNGLGKPLRETDPLMKGGPKEDEGEELVKGFGGHL